MVARDDHKEIGAWRLDASWTERCRFDFTIDCWGRRKTSERKKKREKKKKKEREKERGRNNQVADTSDVAIDASYFFPNGAHEFYTFSMGARLSIPASLAPLYISLSSCTRVRVHTTTQTHTQTHVQPLASTRVRVHRQIRVSRHVENAFSAGARDAIRNSLTLCKVSEGKCVRRGARIMLFRSAEKFNCSRVTTGIFNRAYVKVVR